MTPSRILQLAMVIVVLAYPLLAADSPVYGRLGALVLLGAISASAWNIVGGYAGQVSVGHAVFFGIGAYASVTGFVHLGLPPIAGAPIGMVVSVLVAAVIGVPTLRLSGHYFSMATIAVGELVRVLASTSDFLGGAQGLGGPPMPRNLFDLSFVSATPYYYIFLAVLVALLALTWWIERSRMGFYLRAIKDSERAARSLGVSAGHYKLYAYMLSAAFTSLAGSLYLCMFGFIDPESGFGILISVKMVVMAALGGAGQLFGPLVGALILVPLEELSNSYLGGQGAGITFVVYGEVILLIATWLPGGLLSLGGAWQRLRRDWAHGLALLSTRLGVIGVFVCLNLGLIAGTPWILLVWPFMLVPCVSLLLFAVGSVLKNWSAKRGNLAY